MADADSVGVTEMVAREYLLEMRELGGVLVAEGDFGGDEIRYNEDHDGTPYQIRPAISGKPSWCSEDVLVDLLVENAQELHWKRSSNDSLGEDNE